MARVAMIAVGGQRFLLGRPWRSAEGEAGDVKIGMCMASLLDRDWEPALDATLALGVTSVEVMGGGHVPRRHCDPLALAQSAVARDALMAPLRDRGMEL